MWGDPAAIKNIRDTQLWKLLEKGGALGGYKTKDITVYLPREHRYGARASGMNNVERIGCIMTPSYIRPGLSYAVSHIEWTPSVAMHLIDHLDLHR
jgi:hypothetical protein